MIQDFSGWTIEQLKEKISELIKVERSNKAKIILLLDDISCSRDKISLFEKKEGDWLEFYQNWEEKKKKFLKNLKEENQKYHEINLQKVKLKEEKNSLLEKIADLDKSNQNLRVELQNNEISIELSRKDFDNLKRSNFISKVKLYSVLIVDSSRNVLPSSFSNVITYTETALLASEISSTSNKLAWGSFAFFLIFSIISGFIRIFYFLMFLFWKIFIKLNESSSRLKK